jgi:hypothetical protein
VLHATPVISCSIPSKNVLCLLPRLTAATALESGFRAAFNTFQTSTQSSQVDEAFTAAALATAWVLLLLLLLLGCCRPVYYFQVLLPRERAWAAANAPLPVPPLPPLVPVTEVRSHCRSVAV